jgi:hypothetical protein
MASSNILFNESKLSYAIVLSLLTKLIYSGTSSKSEGIRDEDTGVIFNIITLYSDVVLEEMIARMSLTIMVNVQEDSCYLGAVNCDGPDMVLRDITKKLTDANKKTNRWTYQKIFERVKATCFSPDREDKPNFKKGPKKVAEHFQV